MEFRERLKRDIDNLGKSQREFAALAGMTHSNLNSILNGKIRLSVRNAILLESEGVRTAEYWLHRQVNEDIFVMLNNTTP